MAPSGRGEPGNQGALDLTHSAMMSCHLSAVLVVQIQEKLSGGIVLILREHVCLNAMLTKCPKCRKVPFGAGFVAQAEVSTMTRRADCFHLLKPLNLHTAAQEGLELPTLPQQLVTLVLASSDRNLTTLSAYLSTRKQGTRMYRAWSLLGSPRRLVRLARSWS